MENDTKAKMLLATLSQCVADRDKAAANIAFVLEHGCTDINENILLLKQEFEKISKAELTMEAIQVYYAKHCPIPEQKEKNKQDGNDNTP
jgi:hypothetical protein